MEEQDAELARTAQLAAAAAAQQKAQTQLATSEEHRRNELAAADFERRTLLQRVAALEEELRECDADVAERQASSEMSI